MFSPQTLTYPEHRTAALHLPAHPGPFPASGKGVGGKGRYACGYLGSVSVRSTDLDFSWEKNLNSYPALQATGVLGQRPKRVLLTFARTKVSPRRVGVLIKFSKKLSPPEVIADFFMNAPPVAVQIILFYKAFPAEGDCKLFHEYPPAGACKSFFPRRHMTSGAEIFSIARVFSSTVAVARHRAARAAQTAWSSHFTRQFW